MKIKSNKIFKSDLSKSISSGYLLFFINNVVAIFLTPYMLQFISKEEYGFYILCVDFLAWVSFMELGTNKVVESKSGHLIANKNDDGLNKTFNASFFFQIFVAAFIFPFFYFLLYSNINENPIQHAEIIIILFSVSAALSVFKNLYSALIISSKKVHLDNKIKLVNNIFNYTLILLLVPYIGVLGLAVISVLTSILLIVRSKYRVDSLFPKIQIKLTYFDKEELKSLFSMGIYFSLGSIASLLLVKIDSYIISIDFGFEKVAFFYITVKIFLLTQKLFQMLLSNIRPYVAQLYGGNEFDKIYTLYNIITPIYFTLLSFSISIGMLINELFVSIWVGDSFFLSIEFSVLFGFWILLETHTLSSRLILIPSLYKIKSLAIMRLIEAGVRIIFIIITIKLLGINSLPISSIIACLFFGVIFFSFQTKNYFFDHEVNFSSNFVFFPIILTIIIFSLYFANIIYLFPYVLLISSILVGVVTVMKSWKKLKTFYFLIK
ncbi:MAG: hypothetical protein CMC04_05950 [Flavobacteriaceae bacterium]|nr:hypothetical protein [Flavobacteriaceae bacterium]